LGLYGRLGQFENAFAFRDGCGANKFFTGLPWKFGIVEKLFLDPVWNYVKLAFIRVEKDAGDFCLPFG
jgi:hypothetical protein